jgi:3-oxoacyl-[acyl-carrier protein] reductase
MMDLGLEQKVALVLGAGGGLGSAIARTLAREGAHIAVADIMLEAAEETAAAIVGSGGIACAVAWDLANFDSRGPHRPN